MPIYQTAHYQVKADAVGKVKEAINEFVDYVRRNEPTTCFYAAWQAKEDPSKFVHLFTFEDERAHAMHGQSEAVKQSSTSISPNLWTVQSYLPTIR